MGKILLAVIVVVGVVLFRNNFLPGSFEHPEVLASSREGNGIKQHEFQRLFDQNRPLSSLAKDGYYTVVEGYLNSCAICKRLEADFPAFLSKRKDVVIQRVHFPEGGMQISVTGSDQANMQRQADELNQRIQSYNFCSTPHIEIYDADRQLLVADTCTNKPATSFLQQWIAAE
jgi:hypothetical protein